MQLQQFDIDTLTTVYKTLLPQEFHPEEVKPLDMALRLYQQGLYSGYGLYEGDTLIGYAFFCCSANRKDVLLDYYVIQQEHRSAGYGGIFLKLLQQELSDYGFLLIEVENPAYAADAADWQQRLRRIAFYERNGCSMTAVRSDLFAHPYCIMVLPLSSAPEDAAVYEGLKNVYLTLLGEKGCAAHVHLSMAKKKE